MDGLAQSRPSRQQARHLETTTRPSSCPVPTLKVSDRLGQYAAARAWNPSRVRIAGAQYTQQSALWDVSTRTTANQDLVDGGFGSQAVPHRRGSLSARSIDASVGKALSASLAGHEQVVAA
jgi:hypothetical protein